MINSLIGVGGIEISNGYANLPYIQPAPNNPMQGMVRIHNNDMQVFNGSMWLSVASAHAVVQLNSTTQKIIKWAEAKMNQEAEYAALAITHPSVAFALQAVDQSRQELDLIVQLCSAHTTGTKNAQTN